MIPLPEHPPLYRYLTDENIGQSVVIAIFQLGREVTKSRTVSPGASDQVLEQVATEQGWILVTHDRDFQYSASKKSLRALRESAPTIRLTQSSDSAAWITQAIPLIESQIVLAKEHGLSIRTVRIKEGVINVEFAF